MRDYNFEAQVFAIVEASIGKEEATHEERMKPAFKQNGISIKLLAEATDTFEHSTWEDQDDILEVVWRLDEVSICLDQTGYASVMVNGDERALKPSQIKRLLKEWKRDGVMGWELEDMIDAMRA